MTLIVTITRPDTIWLLADRRLSGAGRGPKDDACKVMFLETTDGKAILGYTGVGATGLGNQPADWMARVLHGKNLPLEQSLGVLADEMKKQLPRHMNSMPAPAHSVFATTFLANKPRLYGIEMFSRDRRQYFFRYTYFFVDGNERRPPWLIVGGSGLDTLSKDKVWIPPLLQILRWHDRGQVPTLAVADHLAKLNHQVHLGDKTVGPRCIVAWRHKAGGIHMGGSSQQLYNGTARDDASEIAIPWIVTGHDHRAIIGSIWPQMLQALKSRTPFDGAAMQQALDGLPRKSDENLK